MIKIGTTTLSPGAWMEETAWSGIQRGILEDMLNLRTVWSYQNRKQLQFELRLREQIILSSVELSRSGADYTTFEDARCNPNYWSKSAEGGFQIQPFVEPAAAIRDFYTNGSMYGFECATAMLIVLYKAVLESIGAQAFNKLFQDLYLFAWEYDKDLGLNTEKREEYLPADIQYFKNPDVSPQHMEFQGENVVFIEDGQYFGHGIGVVSGSQIISFLNQYRKPLSFRSAYMLDQSTRPDFRYLSQFTDASRIAVAKLGENTYRMNV